MNEKNKKRRSALRLTAAVGAAVLLLCTGCGRQDGGQAADTGVTTAAAGVSGRAAEVSGSAAQGLTAPADAAAGGTVETADLAAAGATQAAGAGLTAEAAVPGQEQAQEYRGLVVIDPGHQQYANTEQEPVGPGASETKMKVTGGAIGAASGVPEYQLALDIGLKLRQKLEDRGFQVIMTREDNDVDISNSERAQVANEADADVFVRIHANSIGDGGHSGAMAICQTPGNAYNGDLYAQSRALSDCILNAYTSRTNIRYEQVWETDTMSGINWCRVPVTILEMGYLSNGEEDLRMQDPQVQEDMTDGIAEGIEAYFSLFPKKERGNGGDTGSTQEAAKAPEIPGTVPDELQYPEGIDASQNGEQSGTQSPEGAENTGDKAQSDAQSPENMEEEKEEAQEKVEEATQLPMSLDDAQDAEQIPAGVGDAQVP